MAFNRKAKLRDNIEAIRTAFELDGARRAATPQERERLTRYCGFGGLKCILNPASDLTDAVRWAKSDLELFPMTVELHRLIREHSTSDNEYKRYIDSLKSSVLTAFYTPSAVTEALADVLNDYSVRPRRLLEPSAGHGAFVEAFLRKNADADVMAPTSRSGTWRSSTLRFLRANRSVAARRPKPSTTTFSSKDWMPYAMAASLRSLPRKV